MINMLGLWEISGLIFTVVVGTFLHSAYRWSGKNPVIGFFSPVNESVWEHLKLLFVPMVLFSLAEYFVVGKNYPNFAAAKSYGILWGILVILMIHYTYTGIIGKSIVWADITTFLVAVAAATIYSWKMMLAAPVSAESAIFSVILIILFALFFALFTWDPPKIPLFLDPISGGYGIHPKSAKKT
ncbi:DUF6512 family protein [Caproiciproducens sp. LBM24188]|nr:hypothetical protein [Clostridiales bacterium]